MARRSDFTDFAERQGRPIGLDDQPRGLRDVADFRHGGRELDAIPQTIAKGFERRSLQRAGNGCELGRDGRVHETEAAAQPAIADRQRLRRQ